MARTLIKRILPALFRSRREKGIAILIVLAMIFFILILAHIVLSIISSEFRLVQHKISRTQSYYLAMAGIHYAYNRLTVGDPNWPVPTTSYVRYLCEFNSSNCPGTVANNDINEPNLPNTVDFVVIGVTRNTFTASAPITNTPPNPPEPIPGCNPCVTPAPPAVNTCICARASYND